ncbi:hypothetical protein MTZ49_08980 [Entomomonas sp. E2T0]|uniref:hypothetical protein n=1 Tax=Entomomonas sp. E2T0 TaxID=2930213 RepID=UPI0022283D9D|nr:hypothetical protein [Entomomonas sp. E2T0]UYZ82748.1 hypothetical protein MTZ49_08980 [Entomomonas sp. E2T0]
MKTTIKLIAIGLFALASKDIVAQDVAGIKIGESFSAQKSLITKANSDYQLNDITRPGGNTVGINAIAKKDGRVIDQMLVIHNDSGIVWFVGRAQALEKGARINPDTLMSSLKEKYGNYSEISGTGGPRWYFDRQGTLFQGSVIGSPCYRGIGPTGTSFNQVPGTGMQVPTVFPPKCGLEIETSVYQDSKDGMVSAFSVRIIDTKRMFDELNNKSINAENERKQQLEREKANDNKPKL